MAEKPIEDALDSWLGLSEPPKSKEKVRPGGRLDVSEALAFMERGGMSEAQLALGLLGISAHGKALLDGGLTQNALLTLIEAKCRRYRNGSRVSQEGIGIVLEACAGLDEYVDKAALERVRAARSRR